ncbi:unnamed protein product [Brassicogethes aeneus]|uniref:Replication protein A C-terminal domain-containing protein n=1 Tax=Brassicogethes aeneus TaxID=1431903 RepID=A0A9P0B5K9_BRAAE|nr:unnamed protein product [Brassicogethes aeneus]
MSQNNDITENIEEPSKKYKKTQNVVPVVIRQVLQQADANFTLFGMSCQILKLVALVKNIEVLSTKIVFSIEDHTGSVKAILWLENENEADDLPNINVGNYITLYGCLRANIREKLIAAVHINVITDCNVITTHLLEVIAVRLDAEAKSKEKIDISIRNNPCVDLAMSMGFLEPEVAENEPVPLSKMQTKICEILGKYKDNPVGVHFTEIVNQFQPHQKREMLNALQYLLEGGYAYSTIDNAHFKLTNTSLL